MRYIKTPLRYPGGKSRAAEKLMGSFPTKIEEFREPFLGGGSVALRFSQQYPDTPVWVNDKYSYLYNFWVTLRDQGYDLSEALIDEKNAATDESKSRELFDGAKEAISTASPFRQAVLFWILNKCSYSGLTENSAFSKTASVQNFTVRGAQNLKQVSAVIKNWTITCKDYTEVLTPPGENVFAFLDPPYKIKSYLYGTNAELHKGFDHKYFADACIACPHNWMVTYNIDDEISEWFKDYHQENFQLTYGMQHRGSKNRTQQEVLIKNFNNVTTSPLEVLFV